MCGTAVVGRDLQGVTSHMATREFGAYGDGPGFFTAADIVVMWMRRGMDNRLEYEAILE